jgi:hypothetical protein
MPARREQRQDTVDLGLGCSEDGIFVTTVLVCRDGGLSSIYTAAEYMGFRMTRVDNL